MTEPDALEPFSTEEALRWVIKYLDLSDVLVAAVTEKLGKDAIPDNISRQVQRDIGLVADWLEAHPEVSTEIWEYVRSHR